MDTDRRIVRWLFYGLCIVLSLAPVLIGVSQFDSLWGALKGGIAVKAALFVLLLLAMWMVYVVPFIFLLHILYTIYCYCSLLGVRRSIGLARQSFVALYKSATYRWHLVPATALLIAGIAILPYSIRIEDVGPFLFSLIAIPFSSWGLVDMLRPPLILYLGASDSQQLLTAGKCRGEVYPFRIVTFVQSKSRLSNFSMAGDCIRVSDDSEWRKNVFEMIDKAPVVIMDYRNVTEFVRDEIHYLLDSRNLFKVIFLTENGRVNEELSPLIESSFDAWLEVVKATTDARTILRQLPYIVRTRMNIPSHQCGIGFILDRIRRTFAGK